MSLPSDPHLARFDAVVVELYDILCEDGREWHLTSSTVPFTESTGGGEPIITEYIPSVIDHSDIATDTTIDRSAISVHVPFESEIALLFRDYPPSDIVRVRIRRKTNETMETIWFGRITNALWDKERVQLNVESAFTSMKRFGLRRKWQVSCQWALYSAECGVDPAEYSEPMTVVEINTDGANHVYVSVAGGGPVDPIIAGIYADGKVTWINNTTGQIERRSIQRNTTEYLQISGQLSGLSVGDSMSVLRGCNKRLGAGGCTDFNNRLNYGGCPYAPTDSPFGGKSLFT